MGFGNRFKKLFKANENEDNDSISKNFKYFDKLIHSNIEQIVLDSDIVLGDKEASNYLNGIKLDVDNLIIDGNGFSIDARNQTGIFECSGRNITIRNITFKNGFSQKNQGAIYNTGELKIMEATFFNNFTNGNGGAITNVDGEITLKEVMFEENSSSKGGAISNSGNGKMTITGSAFNRNNALYGGAIYGAGGSNIIITDSSFNENSSNYEGGVIYNYNGSKITITESTLNGNISKYCCAIYNEDGSVIISKSTLNQNTGGAVHNKGELTVSESSFIKNTSGAIRNWGKSTISESSFNENSSKRGGAISNGGILEVTDSQFSKNRADSDGGAIYNSQKATLTIENSGFESNISNNEHSFDIYSEGVMNLNNLHFNDSARTILNCRDCYLRHENDEIKEKIHNEGNIIAQITGNEKDFSYLAQLIQDNSSEIILDTDIKLDLGNKEDSKFPEGIMLDRDNIVIDGNGHVIDAQRKTRIFSCSGKNITIINVTFKNGQGQYGGAIENNGELTISGSSFVNNTASEWGGAISNEGYLTISDSPFVKNTADIGGAIHTRGKLEISDSSFDENTSKISGGAIRNLWKELIITKSTFNKNGGHRGVIFNEGGKMTLKETIFNKNDVEGNVLINNAGEGVIDKSRFTQNTIGGNGSVIYHGRGNLKIFNSEISENNSSDIVFNRDYLQLFDVDFMGNQAEYIIVNGEDDESNLGIIDCKFIDDNVMQSIIKNMGKSCTLKKAVFENDFSNAKCIINQSDLTLIDTKMNGNGKSIFNEGYILLQHSNHLLDRIYGDGKVDSNKFSDEKFDFSYLDRKIHDCNTKEVVLENDICFETYEIEFYEGGIELDIDDLVIDGNGHAIDGIGKSRIFLINGKNITLKNITFKNGYTLKNKYDNPVNKNGGALRINFKSKVAIENCNFINNLSEGEGGAIFNNRSKLTISKSTFDENAANENGGAIYNNHSELIMSESLFNKNMTTLKAKKDHGNGGAIFSTKGSNVSIRQSSFTENTARRGGAINNEDKIDVYESKFTKNSSQHHGGSIYNSMATKVSVDNCKFDENTAKHNGGSIYNDFASIVSIKKSDFIKNTAGEDGGAIKNINNELNIIESTFKNNSVEKNDGGAINNSGRVLLKDSSFTENTAQGEYSRGGAIQNNNRSNMTIVNSEFIENMTKGDGGAIYEVGTKLTANESTFSKNTAEGNGGAIYNHGEETLIEDSTITRNIAKGDGGGIYDMKPKASKHHKSRKITTTFDCEIKKNKPNNRNLGSLRKYLM